MSKINIFKRMRIWNIWFAKVLYTYSYIVQKYSYIYWTHAMWYITLLNTMTLLNLVTIMVAVLLFLCYDQNTQYSVYDIYILYMRFDQRSDGIVWRLYYFWTGSFLLKSSQLWVTFSSFWYSFYSSVETIATNISFYEFFG